MATVATPRSNYPAEIIGYAQPWIVSPGDTVDIKVCSLLIPGVADTTALTRTPDLMHRIHV